MFVSLFQRNIAMTFDKILENNTLWAVWYDGEADNSLRMVFNQWNDPEWLWNFHAGARAYAERVAQDGTSEEPADRAGCNRCRRI